MVEIGILECYHYRVVSMKAKNKFLFAIFLTCIVLAGVVTFSFYKSTFLDRDESPKIEKLYDVKVITSFASINSLLERKEKAILVIGKKNCTFCDRFKPVLKSAIEKYNVEINYVDIKSLAEEDYKALLESDILVPGKCNKQGKDSTLKDGFGTPLSLLFENGTTVDCLRGYADSYTLETFLLNNYLIKK